MKVLTIKQPYATLIAEGIKQYEFRSWKTSFRGEFYIHAGLGMNQEMMKKYKDYDYPRGEIIAKAKLTDCIKVDDSFKKKLKKLNPVLYKGAVEEKDDLYAFQLEEVEKIKPIPAKGKLSFWEYKK